jgi:lysophospholipase L1-like esterase
MKTRSVFRGFFAALLAACFAATLSAQAPAPALPAAKKKEATPFSITRFQSSIDAFLTADKTNPPPPQAILFIGSSIFRQWESLTKQMAPLPVFNRAFGGSRTNEVLHYADTIVVPYAPKLIVYYCGSNDINADAPPPEIAANFRAFVERVHAKLPQTHVLFVSIIRAPQKQEHWDRVDAANTLIRDYCASDPRLGFVDVNPAVFTADGKPRMELYRDDKLHYHPPAYVEFTAIIKPVVEKTWREISATEKSAH